MLLSATMENILKCVEQKYKATSSGVMLLKHWLKDTVKN
jgi:hypothetical protein